MPVFSSGSSPSPAQSGPLAHPEAMLFVHNGQGEALNSQTLFQERVPCPQQISRPRRNRRKHPTPRLCLQPGVQHRNRRPPCCPSQPRCARAARPALGGCHEQALAAGPRNEQGGSKGHHGLAAAHVTCNSRCMGVALVRSANTVRMARSWGRRGRKGQRGSRRREHRSPSTAQRQPVAWRARARPGPARPAPRTNLEGETLLRRGLPDQKLCQFLVGERGLRLMDLA